MRVTRYSCGNLIDAVVVGEPVTRGSDTRLPVKDVEGGAEFYLCFEQTEVALYAFDARKGSVLELYAIPGEGVSAVCWLVVGCSTGGVLVRPDALPVLFLDRMRLERGVVCCEGVTMDGELVGISERGLMIATGFFGARYGDVLLMHDSDNVIGVDYDTS